MLTGGGWWVHSYIQNDQIPMLLSWVFWVIFSICLHELAHGWTALWQGDDTPRRLNRMTMNPLVHMGGMSLLVFALIGIAWGVMPTDPSQYRNRRWGRVLVAAAGPAMNIALALVSLTSLALWATFADGAVSETLFENIADFLFLGGLLNIVLAAFNMLPIPPLDGSQVLSGLSFQMQQFFNSQQSQMFGLFVLLAIFITGAAGVLFGVAAGLSNLYVDVLRSLLP